MMKKYIINCNVGPRFAWDRGRLNVANAFRYVGIIRPLNFTSELSQLSRVWGVSTSASTASPKAGQPFSEQWCKNKKVEILKKGLPAVFEDMSKLKASGYFAVTKIEGREKPLSFYSLKDKAGIYMITNKKTKKFYIGMSKNLKARFYNYLIQDRLLENKSSRIHKALLKDGYENFSISILEFIESSVHKLLIEREDFYIRVFKPQYNIKRSQFNLDLERVGRPSYSLSLTLPKKIQSLLDKCLDPNLLDWHLIDFAFAKRKAIYGLVCLTPKSWIRAYSSGWFEGNITKPIGFTVLDRNKNSNKPSNEYIFSSYKSIDKDILLRFYPKNKHTFVLDSLKAKKKAFKKSISSSKP